MKPESDGMTTDSVRAAYQPPQALRLGSTVCGTGGIPCGGPGSGAVGCNTGFTADGVCESNGNTATDCLLTGSGQLD
jgi:hypothetical protein